MSNYDRYRVTAIYKMLVQKLTDDEIFVYYIGKPVISMPFLKHVASSANIVTIAYGATEDGNPDGKYRNVILR